MKWLCALAAVACLGLGCKSGNTAVSSDQSNGSCDDLTLPGTEGVGAACGNYTDCLPFCCTCSNGDGNSYAAAECDVGSCAGSSVTCADAEDSALCP